MSDNTLVIRINFWMNDFENDIEIMCLLFMPVRLTQTTRNTIEAEAKPKHPAVISFEVDTNVLVNKFSCILRDSHNL